MNKIIATILLLCPFLGFAQVDWEDPKGNIKNEEIVIEKDKQISLPPVSRRFAAIATTVLLIDTTAEKYTPKEIYVDLPKIPVKLRPRTMKSEALNKTYWGNFKVGYGSYVSPYIKADVASKRSDEYAVALHFKHFSSKNGPIDGANSGLSNTDAFLSGKLFLNQATIGAKLGSKFDLYHLYGYSVSPIPEPKEIRQRISNYSIGLNVTDNDNNEDMFYALSGGVELFSAKDLTWTESDYYLNITTNFTISTDLQVKLLGNLHTASQDNKVAAITNNRLYYRVKPIGIYAYGAFDFELGVGIYGVKDSINTKPYKTKLYLTPHVVARYNFSFNHTIAGGVKGDVTWKSARILFDKNPYLGGSTVINNEVKPIDIFIEANGKAAPKVDYSIGYHAAIYKVFGQFVNNVPDQSTFYINYQTTGNLIHSFSGQLDFVTSKNLVLTLRGKYLFFDFDLIRQPYHFPKVDVGFKALFNANDKLTAEFALSYLDGIYAQDLTLTETDVKLNSIVDLNLSANYKLNNTLSVFIKMQNIVGNQYQYFYRYPSKGFQFLAGVSFTL